jgi:prevent-host-death family protein
MKVGIHEAKTKLSKLIPSVLAGEEVIITKAGRPLVKLVPVAEQGGKRPLGAFSGKVRIKGDLLEPLPKEIINGFWLEKDEDAFSTRHAYLSLDGGGTGHALRKNHWDRPGDRQPIVIKRGKWLGDRFALASQAGGIAGSSQAVRPRGAAKAQCNSAAHWL